MPDEQNPLEQPIIFEDEKNEDNKSELFQLKKEKVSDKDIFNLAKNILLSCAVIYLILAVLRIKCDGDGVKDVWEYSKVFLNSIISLVLGLYFGAKKK